MIWRQFKQKESEREKGSGGWEQFRISLSHLTPIWSLLLIYKHLLRCALFLSLSLFQLVLCPLVRDQIAIPHLPAFLLLLLL